MRSSKFLLITVFLFLAACGVDTTGISADSSRRPAGTPSASVVVTEYGDLQCPACKAAHEQITEPLLKKYGSRIRFEFKHFPLQAIHRYAMEAAEASECAADQGKFWEYLGVVYGNQDELTSTQLRTWAADLKLDTDLFERCVSSEMKRRTIRSDQAEGEKIGVNSTPTFFVNGQRVTLQVVSDLDTAVAAALAQSAESPL